MARTVFLQRFLGLGRDRSGVAAVEFAIGAPMMILGMVVMTDLGLAIHERMNLDQAVRAGAEFAMHEVRDTDELEKLMTGAAVGEWRDTSDPDVDVSNYDPPTVDASVWCECPDNPGVTVACGTTICTSTGFPPSVYYQLTAERIYEGIILPNIPLSTEIRVQVR